MKEMNLGDRMKMYEKLNTQYLMPNQYVLMRLDGRNFSNFTNKFFKKPFDCEFAWLMENVMEYLVNNIDGAVAGYTQSDEITILLTDKKSKNMEGWFNYRYDKMCSIAAAMASSIFATQFQLFYLPNLDNLLKTEAQKVYPVFDCRIWQVPNDAEVKNVFLWRQRDCIRNSVLQYGYSFFTHNEMMNKNIDEVKNMIKTKGYNWDDIDVRYKYGVFYFPKSRDVEEDEWFYEQMNSDNISNEFTRIFNDVYKY